MISIRKGGLTAYLTFKNKQNTIYKLRKNLLPGKILEIEENLGKTLVYVKSREIRSGWRGERLQQEGFPLSVQGKKKWKNPKKRVFQGNSRKNVKFESSMCSDGGKMRVRGGKRLKNKDLSVFYRKTRKNTKFGAIA